MSFIELCLRDAVWLMGLVCVEVLNPLTSINCSIIIDVLNSPLLSLCSPCATASLVLVCSPSSTAIQGKKKMTWFSNRKYYFVDNGKSILCICVNQVMWCQELMFLSAIDNQSFSLKQGHHQHNRWRSLMISSCLVIFHANLISWI